MKPTDPLIRFWRHVKKEPSGCWQWVGAKKPTGYGNFYMNSRYMGAHCASYLLFSGEIQEGKFVCHKCDNPSCVNPEHLFLGSPKENMRDMMSKGRAIGIAQGEEAHPESKLTAKNVVEIRQLRAGGETLKNIGARFGITESNVHYIVTGKTWCHVDQFSASPSEIARAA
ncbi:MAG: HNH endonuclease [Burkholderiaceae bacterium]|nr:HNH endonuclease [Burkholderiaceae bacterium]